MDVEDEGIFLFAKSSKKVRRIEETVNVKEVLASGDAKDTWEAVYKRRPKLPVFTKELLQSSIVISGEDVQKWAQIYSPKVADIYVKMDKAKPKAGCRYRKRTRRQRNIARQHRNTD